MKDNIQYLIHWKLKTPKSERGFVTLEVIVALIVGLAFFAIGLQTFGSAVAMKALSVERRRANEIIQEDIERIGQLGNTSLNPINIPAPAGSPPDPIPACNPVATALDNTTAPTTPARTAYENSYAAALWTALDRNAPENTLQRNVVNRVDTTTGAVTNTGGRVLALERFNVSGGGNSVAPHRTLEIGYQVWYWGDPGTGTNDYLNREGTQRTPTDEPIAETYVEIIPDVALSCP
ncbi:MAG: hypothetical protein AAFY76_18820 [Cyanobacteria bacterium J06649_11]